MINYSDIRRMPKDEDVTDIDAGDHRLSLVQITPENQSYLRDLALSMYTDEPCRICGIMLTINDIQQGAVFAGYSSDNAARAAHKECWEKSPGLNGLPNADWVHQ